MEINYAKRIAYAHTLTPEQIEEILLAIPHERYRAVLELCFLTMSRISEVCLVRTQDIRPWKFRRRAGYLLILGTLKRQGAAKIVPLVKEPMFSRIYEDVQAYLDRYIPKGTPDKQSVWLFGDPGLRWVRRKRTIRCRKKEVCERDNLLRKRIWRYCDKHHLILTPHLWRHARSAICQWTYRMTEQERQSLGNWKRRESMASYERFGNPYELAVALSRRETYAA